MCFRSLNNRTWQLDINSPVPCFGTVRGLNKVRLGVRSPLVIPTSASHSLGECSIRNPPLIWRLPTAVCRSCHLHALRVYVSCIAFATPPLLHHRSLDELKTWGFQPYCLKFQKIAIAIQGTSASAPSKPSGEVAQAADLIMATPKLVKNLQVVFVDKLL